MHHMKIIIAPDSFKECLTATQVARHIVNGKQVMNFKVPLSKYSYEEGVNDSYLIENIQLNPGDQLKVTATVGTDGAEFSRARWGGILLVEAGKGKKLLKKLKNKGITETIKK